LYDETLRDARFPEALLALDVAIGQAVRAAGCPHCGAALDAGHYQRKPRGGPWALSEEQSQRLSYCCRRDGCRRRAMPASVRFLGRRVYLGVIVLLAGLLQQGPAAWRVSRLAAALGVDRRTLIRWRTWWTTTIAGSRQFEIGRADFMPPPAGSALPASLVEGFAGTGAQRLVAALRWLADHFGSRYPGDRQTPAEDAR